MTVDWKKRPNLIDNISAIGVGKAIYAAPDGDKINARLLIAADGFHMLPCDFEGLSLESLSFSTVSGNQYVISFDDSGNMLINGNRKETILTSPNGTKFTVSVDDDGKLTAEKEVSDGSTNNNV
ncbi:hypothetical protein LNP18_03330 [Leuconostoc citreum]|uniref:hypothetical protein n=1 Tax=Leuconostoc citreum TaxID=33964 RepID=UPI00200B8C84|nr:hypothetical protein [Leuconostoc citreum]MCK8605131.1 hypothetical protein [Leuconostoc citreum]